MKFLFNLIYATNEFEKIDCNLKSCDCQSKMKKINKLIN